LLKPKRFASVLSERIGFQRLHRAEYIFIPQHIIFPGGSVMPGSRWSNVWSIDNECKTKNWCIL